MLAVKEQKGHKEKFLAAAVSGSAPAKSKTGGHREPPV